MSPPRESYIRTSYPMCWTKPGAPTVDFGLEWRRGDDTDEIRIALKKLAGYGSAPSAGWSAGSDAMEWAHVIGDIIQLRWPGRAYFIEVSGADDSWVQVFQPYGLPRRESTAVLGREEHKIEEWEPALERIPHLVIDRSLRGDLSPVDVHLHPRRFHEVCRHLAARPREAEQRRPTSLMEVTIQTAVGVVRVVSDVTLGEHVCALQPSEVPCPD